MSNSKPQRRRQRQQRQRTNESLYIALSGLIGAGKTTLSKELGRVLNLKVYHEPVADNPYLADFYGDMKQHGFAMQIYLLNERFRQQQAIVWSGNSAVQDRSIYEDKVFAAMLRDDGIISERNYATYEQLFANMSKFMSRPTLLVYLDVKPETALQRIEARGRACENSITLEYLAKLHASYERFINEIAKTVQVLRIDYSQFHDAKEMARVIQDHVHSMGRAAVAKPRSLKCFNCNKNGHKSKECELPQRRHRKALATGGEPAVEEGVVEEENKNGNVLAESTTLVVEEVVNDSADTSE